MKLSVVVAMSIMAVAGNLPSVNVRQGDYVETIADPAQRRSRNPFTRFISRVKAYFN